MGGLLINDQLILGKEKSERNFYANWARRSKSAAANWAKPIRPFTP